MLMGPYRAFLSPNIITPFMSTGVAENKGWLTPNGRHSVHVVSNSFCYILAYDTTIFTIHVYSHISTDMPLCKSVLFSTFQSCLL